MDLICGSLCYCDASLSNMHDHRFDCASNLINGLGPSTYHLATTEEEGCSLWFLQPEDEPRKDLGVIFRPIHLKQEFVEVKFCA